MLSGASSYNFVLRAKIEVLGGRAIFSAELKVIQYTVYSIQHTVYSIQYTVYSITCNNTCKVSIVDKTINAVWFGKDHPPYLNVCAVNIPLCHMPSE